MANASMLSVSEYLGSERLQQALGMRRGTAMQLSRKPAEKERGSNDSLDGSDLSMPRLVLEPNISQFATCLEQVGRFVVE